MGSLTCTGLQATGGEVHGAGPATPSGAIPVATPTGHGARRPGAPLPTRTWGDTQVTAGLSHPGPRPLHPPDPRPQQPHTHLRTPHPSSGGPRIPPGTGPPGGPLLGLPGNHTFMPSPRAGPCTCPGVQGGESPGLRTPVVALTSARPQAAEFGFHVGALARSAPEGSGGSCARPEAPPNAHITAASAQAPPGPGAPATGHCQGRCRGEARGV